VLGDGGLHDRSLSIEVRALNNTGRVSTVCAARKPYRLARTAFSGGGVVPKNRAAA
jgi:hypothetical protein